MFHRILDAQLGVLVLDGVIGVRISGDDLFEVIAAEGFAILLGQDFEEAALTCQPLGVTVAILLGTKDAIIDAQGIEDVILCFCGL